MRSPPTPTATEKQLAAANAALALGSNPEQLLDLSELAAAGDRAAEFRAARDRLQQAALEELAGARQRAAAGAARPVRRRVRSGEVSASRRSTSRTCSSTRATCCATTSAIREAEQLRFRSIMVDEFQDTNRLQCDVVDLLRDGPGAPDVFFVGDEFQSIYGFRHADVDVFRERRAAAAQRLPLARNYRSRPEVLAAVNHLFGEEFGERLPAARRVRRVRRSGVRPSGRAARHRQAQLPRGRRELARGRGARDRAARARARRHGRRCSGRDRAALRGRHRRRAVRGGAARAGSADLPRHGPRLLRPAAGGRPARRTCGCCTTATTTRRSPRCSRRRSSASRTTRSCWSAATPARRPLYTGIERSLPEALSEDDERLVRAFKQRYERLVAASARLSLERLCEEIVSAHDYDLAVLAQWDGKRRYANLRKLMRLARSYEELRGADIDGFVKFIRDQEAVGASQLEAVSEEEGADAVRLLTIHAAKGLEFKVVIVADAGRDTAGAPSTDEILVGTDGRFGFRVIDPTSGKRKGVFSYEEVREAEKREDRAERLRLYYVAMTRAVDRLIVSGRDRPRAAAGSRDADRLGARAARRARGRRAGRRRAGRARARRRALRAGASTAGRRRCRSEASGVADDAGQLALFAELPTAPRAARVSAARARAARRRRRCTASAGSRTRRSRSSSAAPTATTPSASPGCARSAARCPGAAGLKATEIGDAVHRLLELVDLARPVAARRRASCARGTRR